MTDNPHVRTRHTRVIWCLAAFILCLYIGAYWALVKPGLSLRGGRVRSGPVYANHRGTQRALDRLFWPVHQVDRVIRSSYWQAEISDVPMMEAN